MVRIALIILSIIYMAGFLLFVSTAEQPPNTLRPADGIVVLTGGPLRLEAAAALLEMNLGKRLLITGVAPSTTKNELKRLAHGAQRFDCCADLGFSATSTHGNAKETADWVRKNDYSSLIIVTTNYHMPRSLNEFSASMPHVNLEPWPVATQGADVTRWWRNPRTFLLLQGEYLKYLVSLARSLVSL
jgi:uncharacterized SAM-binding protein YcdF (DUF218 family)